VDPNEVANLNQEALYQKLIDLGYPVTRYLIKQAVLRRELKPVRLGNGNFHSVNDGLRWIESRRQEGAYRLPEGTYAAGK
jgi:hypothetical protein